MSLDKQLEKMIVSFAADVRRVVAEATRREILQAVQQSVIRGGGGAGRGGAGRAVKPIAARGPGGKRSPEQMAKQQARLLAHIKSNPNQRMEQIVAGIGIDTNLLQPLIKRLLQEKRIKTKGKARGTTYTAA
jgi:hypothetical protein